MTNFITAVCAAVVLWALIFGKMRTPAAVMVLGAFATLVALYLAGAR